MSGIGVEWLLGHVEVRFNHDAIFHFLLSTRGQGGPRFDPIPCSVEDPGLRAYDVRSRDKAINDTAGRNRISPLG